MNFVKQLKIYFKMFTYFCRGDLSEEEKRFTSFKAQFGKYWTLNGKNYPVPSKNIFGGDFLNLI